MRISGGDARGIRLKVPAGARPASERVRLAVFSAVAACLPGASVLDLYAGSGAYGLEAMSRGADRGVLVDRDPAAAAAIRDNARATGFDARVVVRKRDALRYAAADATRDGPFDLVFADPPYGDRSVVSDLLASLAPALAPGALVVVESRRGTQDEEPPGGYLLEADRRYGDTRVRMYRYHDPGGGRMTTACCPGSFDPVTNGHLDIIERAARLYDRVVVAVVENPSKQPLFELEERVEFLREATGHLEGVEIASFQGLLVRFCRDVGAAVIVKGLRAVTDFDYEMQMAQMNARMGIDTAFMATNPEYSYLSSSLMKEVVGLGGEIDGLVPPKVLERLTEKMRSRQEE